ncbi:hypothetical protein ERICIV_00756 [Paenibacillus larvae subsp. larvae]|uniref:DUF4878 domain-containing protein n=1 Tax=Paenibacillus larvae subsp. larvae TaxID=147375 RepID=A0A2L1TWA6_9BACL|nr:hypothetical protein [Paenibacillus larvae]AQT85587.1 hypothetical protein B1222_16150 [Paenibacillus larvae subsp. pulvifaciens]AQZ47598.1 hypothetical protein B5S25_14450 [Paenibacillus larvae subsp. pulvifaciens]AVF24966.1 hypothetical protein ERICIII_00754 [Paenibacillus larvae subsp. larvae]AVF29729.1 hypothetical protein ERICIV_00756 [Paenibacillus larvae subsp. larvae]MBH0341296.1 hypothetical protein [Paenibacillus larvae]
MVKKVFATMILICLCITPSFSLAKENGMGDDVKQVEQTIYNFYKSLNEKNGELYLQSIKNSESPAYQYIASHLKDVKIDFEIIKIEKVDSKYVVHVSTKRDGIQYPVIPYDVVFENGQWKVDTSTIVFYPKNEANKNDYALEHFSNSNKKPDANNKTVNENENFVVVKKQEEQNGISTRDWRTYRFGQNSAHIYSPGALRVDTFPGPNNYPNNQYNWVIAELYKVESNGSYNVAHRTLSAFHDDWATFQCTGYHYITAYNMNYDQSGKFNVVW